MNSPQQAAMEPAGPTPGGDLFAESVAVLDYTRLPERFWGFEPVTLGISIANKQLPELADPRRVKDLILTVDLRRPDESFYLNLVAQPMTQAVPVGGKIELDLNTWTRAFDGDFLLCLGLHRADPNGGPATPLRAWSPPKPITVTSTINEAFIELTNVCNFKCTFCPQVELERTPGMMDLDLAKKVIRDLAEMNHHHPIRVHLMGEPLLYPHFKEFVQAAHDEGQRVRLATNGSRFKPEQVDMIFESGLDEMVISLNTPDKKSYDEQRGTKLSFEEYIAGIENFVTEKIRRNTQPFTWVNVLYNGDKANDKGEIARVHKICNDWIDFVRRIGKTPLPSAEEKVKLGVEHAAFVDLLPGLSLMWTAYHSWGAGATPDNHFCVMPFKQLAILVDGQATACCVDSEGKIVLGDAKTQSVKDIWNGPQVTRMRENFKNMKAVEEFCKGCEIQHNRAEFFPG